VRTPLRPGSAPRLAGAAALALALLAVGSPGVASSGNAPHARPARAACGGGEFAVGRGGPGARRQHATGCAAPSALAYTGPSGQDYDDPALVSATLTEGPAHPVAGATIRFSLAGQVCLGVTDVAGTATCTIVPDESAGSYTLTARFDGTADVLGSSASVPFLVTSEETALAYTGDRLIASGAGATLAATLAEDGAMPIGGRSVLLVLGSGVTAQACAATTDESGSASCAIAAVSRPPGAVAVSASFSGDGYYLPASASTAAILYAPAAAAGFAVGDRSAAPGSQVTFWSAQWWQANPLTAGSGPAAFKGYIDAPGMQPPACGGAWTTDPGNSSRPPASVPPYLAVVVAGAIGKSGSTISGDVRHIVVVRTDPGYAPNPGHPGTGTVVGTVC